MSFILDILFPKKCVGCGKTGSYFCQDCIADIKQGDLVCPKCERLAVGGQTHPVCKRRFGLDGLWSLGVYQESLRSAVQKLKYGRVRDLAEVLVDIMIDYWVRFQPFVLDEIKKNQGRSWMVVPIPLFFWRQNSRGFNQSVLLGQLLSKKLGVGYGEALKRIRYTRSQVKLKGQDRRKNISGAFEITKSYTLTPNPYILLIDDVWTTGSTMKECCYILKRSGAKKVWALTLAR